MSVKRTPPGTPLISDSGPSQTSVTTEDGESFINTKQRKRKERTEEYDYKKDFANFRADIMKCLEDFGRSQNENFAHIREEISEIKSEIRTINSAVETCTQQFKHIHEEINNIKLDYNITQNKIKQIEDEISIIKDQGSTSTNAMPNPLALTHEDLIMELRDRCDREKNVVFVGINEKSSKDLKARRTYDEEEVMTVIRLLHEDAPTPLKTIRLGKYTPNKSRPVKVFFENTETPKHLLRNKAKLPENIQVYSDQTPSQKKYLQSVKEELKKRMEQGEQDLIIKYKKGIPTIVSNKKNQ